MFAGEKIIALAQSWTFDEVFSDTLIQQFDANGDGAFDSLESKAVAKGTLPNLKKFRYFNYVWVNGNDGVTCMPKVRDDTENAYYGGFVYPQEITLSCH